MLGALFILVTWTVGSYLIALLIAIPHVGRSASQWLRSTPVTFWTFAWPLARRALLHQLLGTLIAMGITLADNTRPLTRGPLTIHDKGIHHGEIVWSQRIGIRVGTEHHWRATVAGHRSVSARR